GLGRSGTPGRSPAVCSTVRCNDSQRGVMSKAPSSSSGLSAVTGGAGLGVDTGPGAGSGLAADGALAELGALADDGARRGVSALVTEASGAEARTGVGMLGARSLGAIPGSAADGGSVGEAGAEVVPGSSVGCSCGTRTSWLTAGISTAECQDVGELASPCSP